MTTFCKTSRGGLNFDNITQWSRVGNSLFVWFCAPGDEKEDNGQDNAEYVGEEAKRLSAILEGVCIFDATKESE